MKQNTMEKIYNQLVRDKIPTIISQDNQVPVPRILDDDAYKKALECKLVEECEEVLQATTSQSRIEELADVIEVVRALAAVEQQTFEEVCAIAKTKRHKRGGFSQKIYLEKITE